MNSEPVTTIRFDPPLPCCIIKGEELCGAPATVGHIFRHGYDGGYDLQPVCEACVKAVIKLYGVDAKPQP